MWAPRGCFRSDVNCKCEINGIVFELELVVTVFTVELRPVKFVRQSLCRVTKKIQLKLGTNHDLLIIYTNIIVIKYICLMRSFFIKRWRSLRFLLYRGYGVTPSPRTPICKPYKYVFRVGIEPAAQNVGSHEFKKIFLQ